MSAQPHRSRDAIRSDQLRQLRRLISQLIPDNAFYALRLREAGLGGDLPDLTTFTSRLPFTLKPDIADDQRLHPPYGSNLTFPIERYTRLHQTSGTSQSPLCWLDTPESWAGMVGNWCTVFEVAGVKPSDHVFFAFSFGPFLGFWLAFEAAARLGCLCIPGGGMSSTARLQAIVNHRAAVLCCTPTYALRLAEVAAAEGMDLAGKVRTIVVAGEPGGSIPAVRARIESAWPGARVFDHHGMTEVGPVTYECPLCPGLLHVMEEAYFPEVVDAATGKACSPGEAGELVLTTLARAGSPLLRYRTGDLVRPAVGSCACGRSDLALQGGILARTDDMVLVRGVNIFPSAVDAVVRSLPEVAEYRVELRTEGALTEIGVVIEVWPSCAEPEQLAGVLQAGLRDAFSLRIPVTTVPAGTLPRFEMKANRWIRT